MTPLFDTKKPHNHDPFVFLLDEGLSGPRLCRLLKDAKIVVVEYDEVLIKNTRTPDDTVLSSAASMHYVLITKDKAMDKDEIESIISYNAKVVVLTDKVGGVPHFAAAIIAAMKKIERALLDNLRGPLVVRLNSDGTITKIRGADELRQRYQNHMRSRIQRGKRIEAKHAKIGTPVRTVEFLETGTELLGPQSPKRKQSRPLSTSDPSAETT